MVKASASRCGLGNATGKGQRNEPGWVAYTAEVLAGLHGVSPGEMGSITTKNFERLFGLTLDV